MNALRSYFAGEGNASRTIADIDRLNEILHYKNERTVAFESFLIQLQKMFNIYKEQGKKVPDDQKVRTLYKKIQNNYLDHFSMPLSPCLPRYGVQSFPCV